MDMSMVVYLLVFAAIVLPVALWRSEDVQIRQASSGGRWENLPDLFKKLWAPTVLLEDSVGAGVAMIASGGRAEF